MKEVTLLAMVDTDLCIGCKICEKVCPVNAIKIVDRKAVVDEDICRGCANCADRCPKYAVKMVKRDESFMVGVDVCKSDPEKIKEICLNAHINPEQILCYCVGVRADEVAAAILQGAKTPEEISSVTGIRTGCSIECVQSLLRMAEAGGLKLERDKSKWQWYGRTATAWDIPKEIKEKYESRGFYFNEDRELMEKVAHIPGQCCCGGEEHDE
ncbi:BFD-like [2Fe-2S] binding domain-containing protein [Dethiosulfatibacter aminovorans DSM 17477]|uniref:BFD-like [2Fe-2S] binding domain-containing protein n=1 Tax=Dethiosulfatibacter aminovorans DSM 17477 TaxID=1121476 RepID=A0A1M6C2R5_9FIRM|nr:4Fe-4S binding protein [Dethiosulfatibacter aminovorans]SHI55306.1 BFD-like [2Fe-2S] binding domain-containing protein [Dethiosulfatibacter aminovorans DSM 17477]